MPYYHHPPQNLSHISPISATTTNKTKQVSANPRFTLFSITHHQLLALLRVCFVSVCLSSVWSLLWVFSCCLPPSELAKHAQKHANGIGFFSHNNANTLLLANEFVVSANERRTTESSWGQQSSANEGKQRSWGRTEFRERSETAFLRTNRVPRTKENSVPEDEQSSGDEEQQSSCRRTEFWNYRRWKTEPEFLFVQLWTEDIGNFSRNALGTCEEHEKPVEDSGNLWGTSWEQNENRMGTHWEQTNLRKWEPHVSDSEVGFMDKTRLGLGFLVQKRSVSCRLGCSIWAERWFHKSKLVCSEGRSERKKN
jgi:hypothetical protein